MDAHIRNKILCYIGIISFVLAFSFFYINITQYWWFEDDPGQYSAIINHFVFNSEIISDLKSFMPIFSGHMVPMFVLSMLFDIKMASFDTLVTFAYCHNAISLLFTALIFFEILLLFTKNKKGSFFVVLIWCILPSTISVFHFLSTRHYMEGFFFALLSIYFLKKVCDEEWTENFFILFLIGLSSFISIFYKEIYTTSLPTFLFLYSVYKKKYKIAGTSVFISIIYAIAQLQKKIDFNIYTTTTFSEYLTVFKKISIYFYI